MHDTTLNYFLPLRGRREGLGDLVHLLFPKKQTKTMKLLEVNTHINVRAPKSNKNTKVVYVHHVCISCKLYNYVHHN